MYLRLTCCLFLAAVLLVPATFVRAGDPTARAKKGIDKWPAAPGLGEPTKSSGMSSGTVPDTALPVIDGVSARKTTLGVAQWRRGLKHLSAYIHVRWYPLEEWARLSLEVLKKEAAKSKADKVVRSDASMLITADEDGLWLQGRAGTRVVVGISLMVNEDPNYGERGDVPALGGGTMKGWRWKGGGAQAKALALSLFEYTRKLIDDPTEEKKEESLKVSVAIDEGQRPYEARVKVTTEDGSAAPNTKVALYLLGRIVRCYWFKYQGAHAYSREVGHAKSWRAPVLRIVGQTDSRGHSTFYLANLKNPTLYLLEGGALRAPDPASGDVSSHVRKWSFAEWSLSGLHLAEEIKAGIENKDRGVRVCALARVDESGDPGEEHRGPCRGTSGVVQKGLDYVARVVDLERSSKRESKPTWLRRHVRLPGEKEHKVLQNRDRLRPDDELLIRRWEDVTLDFVVYSYPGLLFEEELKTTCVIMPNRTLLGSRVASVFIQPTRYSSGFKTVYERRRDKVTGVVLWTTVTTGIGFVLDKVKGTIAGVVIGLATSVPPALKSDEILLEVKSRVWCEGLEDSVMVHVFEGEVTAFGGKGHAPQITVAAGQQAAIGFDGHVRDAGPIDGQSLRPRVVAALRERGVRLPESGGSDWAPEDEFRFGLAEGVLPEGRTDWKALAGHLRPLQDSLVKAQAAVVAGRDPAPDVLKRIGELNEKLVTFARTAAKAMGAESVNHAMTHPAVTANLVSFVLDSVDMPLTSEQRMAIHRAGRAWAEDAAEAKETDLALARIHADVGRRLRFLTALKKTITSDQRATVWHADIEGRAQLDLLSPVLMYGVRHWVRVDSPAAIEGALVRELLQAARIDGGDPAPFRSLAQEWAQGLPTWTTKPRAGTDSEITFTRVEDLHALARLQTAVIRRILASGRLGRKEVEKLRSLEAVVVPFVGQN